MRISVVVVERLRELGEADPEEAVDGRLGDDPREHGRHFGRRFPVGIRQPAVQREDRGLHGEGRDEAQEDPVARALGRLHEVEGVLREAVGDDRGQHQQGPGHRVDDELDRRAHPAGPAPHSDQHVERDQHRLEEGVEDQHVLRGEHADRRAREEEHEPEIGAWPFPSGPDCVRDRRRRDDHGQPGEPEREGVEADVVRDVQVAEPRCCWSKFGVAPVRLKSKRIKRADPETDLHEGHQEREGSGHPPRQRDQPHEERPGDGKEDEQGREPACHRTHTKTRASVATAVRDHERVHANEARLSLGDLTARAARAEGDPGQRARDQRPLDERAKRREPGRGPVEEPVVRLVEVELVLEDRLQGTHSRHGPPSGREPPGESDAEHTPTVTAAREATASRLPVGSKSDSTAGCRKSAKVPHAGDLDPAADHREHGERADGHRHPDPGLGPLRLAGARARTRRALRRTP